LRLFLSLALILSAVGASAQQDGSRSAPVAVSEPTSAASQDAQGASEEPQPAQSGASGSAGDPKPSSAGTVEQAAPDSKQQPKRILGVMPNFRAVSAGEIPPPPTPKQAFMIATKNSFDYSSFIFVGITSAMAEGTDAHPELGKGMAGFGRYYWRGFLDKTDGNYLVIFVLPTIFHQDERYFALGEGGFWKRMGYAGSRVFVARDYHGNNTFNISEVLGRAAAQGISISYYPPKSHTGGALAKKYAFALGRDALTNAFREFWPDIATHVFHRHP